MGCSLLSVLKLNISWFVLFVMIWLLNWWFYIMFLFVIVYNILLNIGCIEDFLRVERVVINDMFWLCKVCDLELSCKGIVNL